MTKRELAAREFGIIMDKHFAYDSINEGVFPLMPRAKYRKDAVLNDAWNAFERELLELVLRHIPVEIPNEL